MNYKKYSDEEVLESYNTMLDYSGKADEDILMEIKHRGGIEHLMNVIAERKTIPNEIKRVYSLVYNSHREKDVGVIRSEITSEILSSDLFDRTFTLAIQNAEKDFKNKTITYRTITGSVLGIIISSFISAAIWYYSILWTGRIFYMMSCAVLIIAYALIRILTGQNRHNIVVFLSAFLSAFISIPIGLWMYSIVTR